MIIEVNINFSMMSFMLSYCPVNSGCKAFHLNCYSILDLRLSLANYRCSGAYFFLAIATDELDTSNFITQQRSDNLCNKNYAILNPSPSVQGQELTLCTNTILRKIARTTMVSSHVWSSDCTTSGCGIYVTDRNNYKNDQYRADWPMHNIQFASFALCRRKLKLFLFLCVTSVCS